MKDSGSARACTWICGAIGEGRSGVLQDPPKSGLVFHFRQPEACVAELPLVEIPGDFDLRWHLQAAEIAVVRAASGPRTQHGLAASTAAPRRRGSVRRAHPPPGDLRRIPPQG